MNYTVWLWNLLPTMDSGYSPDELFSRSKSAHANLYPARVWGSPLYILDARLQNGKKIPKWEKRSTTGIFMGFSLFRSSTISLSLNLTTGTVSPQFHAVHDEFFITTPSFGDSDMSALWDELNIFSRENDYEEDIDDFGNDIPSPVVSAECLDDDNFRERREQERLRFRRLYNQESNSVTTNDIIPFSPPSQPSPSTLPSTLPIFHELNQSLSLSQSPSFHVFTDINNPISSSSSEDLSVPSDTVPGE